MFERLTKMYWDWKKIPYLHGKVYVDRVFSYSFDTSIEEGKKIALSDKSGDYLMPTRRDQIWFDGHVLECLYNLKNAIPYGDGESKKEIEPEMLMTYIDAKDFQYVRESQSIQKLTAPKPDPWAWAKPVLMLAVIMLPLVIFIIMYFQTR